MINDPFQILVVFLGVIALSLLLHARVKVARKLPPVILILFFSALLANTGLLPAGHGFYGQLSGYAVPFAVCMILLHVRLAEIRRTGLEMLKAFAVACLGSFAGCIAAGLLLQDKLDAILSGQGWKLAGPYIGTYIGGSVNFFSMWTGLEIDSPDLFAAANAVDNLTLIPIFMFWVLAPQVLGRWYPQRTVEPSTSADQPADQPALLRLNDIVMLILIGLAIMLASDWIKSMLPEALQMVPSILILTTLALIAAQAKAVRNLHGAGVLGNFAFYLFFAAIGAQMDIAKAVTMAPVLFGYVLIIITLQITVVLLIGRLLKIDLGMLAVASLAAKAGPSTVVAYTSTRNRNDLALSGVAAALLGYAVGNYTGFAGAHLLRILGS
jgi:uncharacterized membrane protein